MPFRFWIVFGPMACTATAMGHPDTVHPRAHKAWIDCTAVADVELAEGRQQMPRQVTLVVMSGARRHPRQPTDEGECVVAERH